MAAPFKPFAAVILTGALCATLLTAGPARGQRAACAPIVGEAWSAVRDVYLDPDFNGVDWESLEPGAGSDACPDASPHAQVRLLLARLGDRAVRLVPASEVSAFLAEMTGEPHIGVGLRELLSLDVDERTALLTVVTPVPGGPAARAGVRSGDVVESIDGVRTDTMDLALAMSRLRGPVGSGVRLGLRRGGTAHELTLQREHLPATSPVVTREPDALSGAPIWHLRLLHFSSGAGATLREAVSRAESAGARGLVLDLRDNPGGMLEELEATAELFLDAGTPIARIRSRPGADTLLVARTDAITHLPLVVLVNRGTASAAEALAGALQASSRGTIVGERTFGKGLAHFATALSDGSLVLAPMGRLETPHGRDILDEGIAPDIVLSQSTGDLTAEDVAAVRALEEAYRLGWLANDSAAVMATLSADAVLMPAGVRPLVGDSAIRGYWWPDDGSETTITSYEITVEEVEGSGGLAYLRGRGALEFTYRSPTGEVSHLTSDAVHLSVARRGPDGEWRIARRAWSALR